MTEPTYSPMTEYKPEIIRSYTFNTRETVCAFLAIVLGYGFVKLVAAPVVTCGALGLGGALFMLAALIFALIYKGRTVTRASVLRYLLYTAFSANIFLSSNQLIQLLDMTFAVMIYAYDMLSTSDERFSRIRNYLPADMLNAFFTLPFHDFDACPKAVKSAAEKTKTGSGVKNAIIGLAIAVLPTVVVAGLLMSADDNFSDILDSIMSDGFSKLFVNAIQIIVGIPVACYIYGMCSSSKNKYSTDCIRDESTERTVLSFRFLPAVTGVFSVLPVCILYVIFFFSQLSYYISGFAGRLPSDMNSYAQYARQGFFELCIVAVINLVLICLLKLLCKGTDNGEASPAVRTMIVILSVFTVLLIAADISKMVMYINMYGLTPLRVYTTWFMVLLGLIFIAVILSVFVKRICLARMITALFTVMLALLSFCNVDSLIADYNADRFIAGTLNTFDLDVIDELSLAAVDDTVKVKDKLTAEENERLYEIISDKLIRAESNGFRCFTLDEHIARDIHDMFYAKCEG